MDWNWFFSSVAQSAAAIVGIFGAFIITKIIGNQVEFNRKVRLLDEMIANSKTFEDEADTRYFKWYNERISDEELQNIENDFTAIGVILSPEEYYEKHHFSIFQSKKEVLTLLKEKCGEYSLTKEKREREMQEKRKSLLPGMVFDMQKETENSSLHVHAFAKELIGERDLIDNLIVRIKQHCRHIVNFIGDNCTNPESSPLVNISLSLTIVLFFVGVIYPLSFLPLRIDSEIFLSLSAFWKILFSLKGVMLTAISVVFMAIVITFLIINSSLKYDKSKMEELRKHSSLLEYSEYFRNMDENMDPKNKD